VQAAATSAHSVINPPTSTPRAIGIAPRGCCACNARLPVQLPPLPARPFLGRGRPRRVFAHSPGLERRCHARHQHWDRVCSRSQCRAGHHPQPRLHPIREVGAADDELARCRSLLRACWGLRVALTGWGVAPAAASSGAHHHPSTPTHPDSVLTTPTHAATCSSTTAHSSLRMSESPPIRSVDSTKHLRWRAH